MLPGFAQRFETMPEAFCFTGATTRLGRPKTATAADFEEEEIRRGISFLRL
jgi:hypothetical protein